MATSLSDPSLVAKKCNPALPILIPDSELWILALHSEFWILASTF